MNQADIFYQKGVEALRAKKAGAALDFFYQAADLGSLDALEKIILITRDEKELDEYKAAVDKFFSIAEKGNVHTAKKIFGLILNNYLEGENCAKGAEILLSFANAGHIDSLKFYHELIGMEKVSTDNATEIFQLLNDKVKKVHSADLMFRLGECYFFGVGTEKNLNAAKFWFQLLVNLELAKDIFERLEAGIAKTYLSNKFDIKAIKNLKDLKRRAQSGEEGAIKTISEIYCKGTVLAPDGNAAVEWLQEISHNTNYSNENRLNALRSIAEIYRYGFGGVQTDTEKAIHYFERMVNLSGQNAFAARNIAEIYFQGEGNVPADKVKAVNWLQIAANYGNAYCIKKLADCYAKGNVVKKDEATAISLYEKLLEGSDKITRVGLMKKIAQLYKNIDKKKSDEWYKRANYVAQSSFA